MTTIAERSPYLANPSEYRVPTRDAHDRLTRSQSSILGDDVGRPVVQHKPLWKGEHEQASLAKVFDDPAMRPKVMCKEPINKPHSSLVTSDIWGATVRHLSVLILDLALRQY